MLISVHLTVQLFSSSYLQLFSSFGTGYILFAIANSHLAFSHSPSLLFIHFIYMYITYINIVITPSSYPFLPTLVLSFHSSTVNKWIDLDLPCISEAPIYINMNDAHVPK